MPTPNLKPDDPYGCHSGKTHGECHGPIFDAEDGKEIAVAQEIYAETWAVNAAHYEAQGLYAVLVADLTAKGEVRRVLDIGCGLGQGLAALAARS